MSASKEDRVNEIRDLVIALDEADRQVSSNLGEALAFAFPDTEQRRQIAEAYAKVTQAIADTQSLLRSVSSNTYAAKGVKP